MGAIMYLLHKFVLKSFSHQISPYGNLIVINVIKYCLPVCHLFFSSDDDEITLKSDMLSKYLYSVLTQYFMQHMTLAASRGYSVKM